MKHLLDEQSLQRSAVVSNSLMNRERGCEGVNSYAKELGFSPLEFLKERLREHDDVAWLDLCCGRGRALIEAARALAVEGAAARLTLLGIDLVAMFERCDPDLSFLQLEQASLIGWRPDRTFDLISCVHGLHYIGDKLALISQACTWLTAEGRFVAHLDLNNVKFADGTAAARRLTADLRRNGLKYLARRHLVQCPSWRDVSLPYNFLGADDTAGPNCTGQPSVDSWYAGRE